MKERQTDGVHIHASLRVKVIIGPFEKSHFTLQNHLSHKQQKIVKKVNGPTLFTFTLN
jgi:hypothetical protein